MTCATCYGVGTILYEEPTEDRREIRDLCPACNGTGIARELPPR